jgi:DNA-directed RNA polymerase subunit RPC12/RpoP
MGYGLRIHCQLCLLLYGCATAQHACSNCAKPFDYDTSMYDDKVTCAKCKDRFGFMYYPVMGEMVNKIRESEAEEEAKRRNAEEREARARARTAGVSSSGKTKDKGDTDDDHLLSLVGKCAIDEECPICGKRVASKHRSHVEVCLKNPPPPKKTRKVRKFIENDDSDCDDGKLTRRRKPSTTTRTTRKPSLASKKPTPKKTRAKRRRADSDDSD